MPATGREIGALFHLGPQAEVDLGWMLQIRVHHREHLAPRHLPPANHGGREPALALTAHDAKPRIRFTEKLLDLPRAVGTVIVDHDDLVRSLQRPIEELLEKLEQYGDVLRFVVSGDDERELDWRSQRRISRRGDTKRALRSHEQAGGLQSEERRVGKECRSRWSPY